MTDHLNVFEPYARKAPRHEDALTRAFLLVLRGVPVAHAAWLDLVSRAHRANRGPGIPSLHELGEPEVEMQTATVPEDIERLVSLVQTDEVYFHENEASRSSRRQVLDGLVTYRTGTIEDSDEDLETYRAWVVDRLLRFKKVFGPRLKAAASAAALTGVGTGDVKPGSAG